MSLPDGMDKDGIELITKAFVYLELADGVENSFMGHLLWYALKQIKAYLNRQNLRYPFAYTWLDLDGRDRICRALSSTMHSIQFWACDEIIFIFLFGYRLLVQELKQHSCFCPYILNWVIHFLSKGQLWMPGKLIRVSNSDQPICYWWCQKQGLKVPTIKVQMPERHIGAADNIKTPFQLVSSNVRGYLFHPSCIAWSSWSDRIRLPDLCHHWTIGADSENSGWLIKDHRHRNNMLNWHIRYGLKTILSPLSFPSNDVSPVTSYYDGPHQRHASGHAEKAAFHFE